MPFGNVLVSALVGSGGRFGLLVSDTRRDNPLGCRRLEGPRLVQKGCAQNAAVRHLHGFWRQLSAPLAVGTPLPMRRLV